MPRSDAFSTLWSAINGKLEAIKLKHSKYSLTLKQMKGEFSIDYSTVKLPKITKHVRLQFSRDTIASYHRLLRLYKEAAADDMLDMQKLCDELEKYVVGWKTGRTITDANLGTINGSMNARQRHIDQISERFKAELRKFNEYNVDETEIVDHCIIPLYRWTDEFPYRRAYEHFFKKMRIREDDVTSVIDKDIKVLDKLVELTAVLYQGYQATGKGDEYDLFRKQQRELILLIARYGDIVENHINLIEELTQIRDLVINFKIFPITVDR